jgi:hypothetical protein
MKYRWISLLVTVALLLAAGRPNGQAVAIDAKAKLAADAVPTDPKIKQAGDESPTDPQITLAWDESRTDPEEGVVLRKTALNGNSLVVIEKVRPFTVTDWDKNRLKYLDEAEFKARTSGTEQAFEFRQSNGKLLVSTYTEVVRFEYQDPGKPPPVLKLLYADVTVDGLPVMVFYEVGASSILFGPFGNLSEISQGTHCTGENLKGGCGVALSSNTIDCAMNEIKLEALGSLKDNNLRMDYRNRGHASIVAIQSEAGDIHWELRPWVGVSPAPGFPRPDHSLRGLYLQAQAQQPPRPPRPAPTSLPAQSAQLPDDQEGLVLRKDAANGTRLQVIGAERLYMLTDWEMKKFANLPPELVRQRTKDHQQVYRFQQIDKKSRFLITEYTELVPVTWKLIDADVTPDGLVVMVFKDTKQHSIELGPAGQFAEISQGIHNRLENIRFGWQLGKDIDINKVKVAISGSLENADLTVTIDDGAEVKRFGATTTVTTLAQDVIQWGDLSDDGTHFLFPPIPILPRRPMNQKP